MFDKTLPCSLARPLKEKSLIAKSGDLAGHSKACFTRYRITFYTGSLSWIRYKKRSSVWVFTRSLENSPVAPSRAKMISLRLPYLLFSLLICQAIDQPHLHWSHPIIQAISYRIRIMFTNDTKRYRLCRIHYRTTYWCGAELYRIVGAERIGFVQNRINTTPIRYEKGSDTYAIRYLENRA